jgi:hypothetical protein
MSRSSRRRETMGRSSRRRGTMGRSSRRGPSGRSRHRGTSGGRYGNRRADAETAAGQVPNANALGDELLDGFPVEGTPILGMNPLRNTRKFAL